MRAPPAGRGDRVGLVAALSPDLIGRVHHAYRRPPDRRRWRRDFPGRPLPELDLVSLCGRRGLQPASRGARPDCGSCERILRSRAWRDRILRGGRSDA